MLVNLKADDDSPAKVAIQIDDDASSGETSAELKPHLLTRMMTFAELQKHYSSTIARLDSLGAEQNHQTSDDDLPSYDGSTDSDDAMHIQNKLEKTWTLILWNVCVVSW